MGTKLIDQYTYLHFATGIIFYYWGVSLKTGLLLHTIFELVENSDLGMLFINSYFGIWPGGKPYADTFINSIGDILGFLAGWYSALMLDNIGNKHNLYKKALT